MKIHKITTQEELDEINEDYFKHHPKETTLKWSGCNYYINKGKIKHESLGTAQSVHGCDCCERVDYCELCFDTPTWFWNEEVEQRLKDITNEYIKKYVM